MQTPKEIFLELLKPDGKPERILKQYEALHMCLYDPINAYLRGNRRRGTTSRDRWGTTISFPKDAPGATPLHGDGLTVCPDITRWREYVRAPDIAANCTEGCRICRWGGEEILIYVPENEIITKGIAEKIRQSIEKIRVTTDTDTVSVTMTFGMAEYSPGLPLNKLVSIADNRLYYGKGHGKNQVISEIPDDAAVLDK